MLKPKRTAYHLFLQLALTAAITLFAQKGFTQIPKLNSYPLAKATVFLDFDGQVVSGTSWNWDSTIHAKASGLKSTQITEIFNRVSEDYRIFNINITTDPAVYSKAPFDKRMRVILTPTHKWYGAAGGVAFVNSFAWGDETPAWVFTTMLNNDSKYIAEATSHEVGHTLGLQHQSTYTKTCGLVTEYAEGKGEGEIGWAPIMGVGYYKNFTTWTYGTSIEGCKVMQNDVAVISKGVSNIGMRADDYTNVRTSAVAVRIISNKFQVSGLINNSTDKDFFRVVLTKKMRLKVTAAPYSVGPGNNGANLDLLVTLMKSNGDTMIKANPKTLLHANFDTLLLAGTYYIGVDGTGNQNVSDYGSVGSYTLAGILAGTTTSTSTSQSIVIKGNVNKSVHKLNWESEGRQAVTRLYLESSFDGIHFVEMSQVPVNSSYTYEPHSDGNIYYRVKMKLPDDSYDYSNTIILGNYKGILVGGNVIRDQVRLNVASDYEYQLFDVTGRLFQSGKLVRGLNTVSIGPATRGLLMLKVFDAQHQFVFRLIRQ